ncbi:hypothetical protein [Ligilactobacillus agilis]|nr:hypothetical protein [Ligilactobacillus agilis]
MRKRSHTELCGDPFFYTKLVLGISQNASMVKAISLNGVKGTVTVDKDGSGTATFAGAAYKEGKGVINFTIDFGQGPYSAIQNVE